MERFLKAGAKVRPQVVAKAKAKGRPKKDVSAEAMPLVQTRARSCQSAKTQELLERVASAEQRMAQMQETLTALSLQQKDEQVSALLSANEELQGIISVTLVDFFI